MTILFVHGTGVRRRGYEDTLARVRAHLGTPERRVEGCLWGDAFGAKLNAGANSIPEYKKRPGRGALTQEEISIELWDNLYSDPFFELRILAIQRETPVYDLPGTPSASRRLHEFAVALNTSGKLIEALRSLGLAPGTLEKARDDIISSAPYEQFLGGISDPLGAFQNALARAIVAQTKVLAAERDPDVPPMSAEQRDELVELVRNQLGPYQAFVGEWVVSKMLQAGRAVSRVAARAAVEGAAAAGRSAASFALDGATFATTPLLRWQRSSVMDFASPLLGDILLYQSQGEAIRKLVLARIREVEPPLVLVGHSLGGVILVDLLIHHPMADQVELLVTVGSQAPYLYEIGALHSLGFGKQLPDYFARRWLNIYDPLDFLAFLGAGIFPGRVTDRRVDNREPFPESHSAYWQNKSTYKLISEAIQEQSR